MLAKEPEERWPEMHDICRTLKVSPPAPESPLRIQLSAFSLGHQPIGTISLDPVPDALFEGQDFTLSATPLDLSGRPLTGRRVSWSSSDPDIAAVSQDGVVRAFRAGAVCISATAEGVSGEIRFSVATIPVDTVVVLPSQLTLEVGESAGLRTLVLTAQGQELEGREVRWTSSDMSVAVVDPEGSVSALRPGNAKVTASCGERSGSASLEVVPRAVVALELSAPSQAVEVGQGVDLRSVPLDAAGVPLEDRAIVWESLNPSVAEVSQTGNLTGVAPGEAVIRAICEGVVGTTSLKVNPETAVRLVLEPELPRVLEGEILELTANPVGRSGSVLTDREVEWESGDASIARIDDDGVIAGIQPGTTRIQAACEGITASVEVTVTPSPVASVEVGPSSLSMTAGEVGTLSAAARSSKGTELIGRSIVWGSSDPSVATVSAEGAVRGLSEGRTQVSATCEGKTAVVEVIIRPAPVSDIEFKESSFVLEVGESSVLIPTVRTETGDVVTDRPLVWSSAHTAVVEVDSGGCVTALKEGTGLVQVQCEGTAQEVEVRVVPERVAEIRLAPPALELAEDEAGVVSAKLLGRSGRTLEGRVVEWSCDHPDVAVPDSTGEVLGKAPGETLLRAACEGQKASVSIRVSPAPVASVELGPADLSLSVTESTQLDAVPRSASGRPLAGRALVWSSRDPSLAEVSEDGRITAKATGQVVIEVACEGHSARATLSVRAEAVESVAVLNPVDSLFVGDTTQLATKISGPSGRELHGRPVTWTSDAAQLAQVDDEGRVTALAPGEVSFFAESGGVSGSVTLRVDPPPVGSVDIIPHQPLVLEGDGLLLKCTPRDAGGNELPGRRVSWDSSDPALVRVDKDGRVVGVAPGKAMISATCEGASHTVQVEVSPAPVTAVEIDSRKPRLRVNEERKLRAVVRGPEGRILRNRRVRWTSSDPSLATLDETGKLVGRGPGLVQVHAETGGVTGSDSLTVLPQRSLGPLRLAGLLTLGVAVVAVGTWAVLTRLGGPALEAPPSGPIPTSLSILPGDSLSLEPGGRVALGFLARDETGEELHADSIPGGRWETSDSTVINVSQAGLVVAAGPGLARVQVSVEPTPGTDPISASAVVVVSEFPREQVAETPSVAEQERTRRVEDTPADTQPTPPPTPPAEREPSVTQIRLSPSDGELTEGETLRLVLTDQDGVAVTGTFETSDPSVATISQDGVLRALQAGEVTVIARLEGLRAQATFEVAALVVDPPDASLSSIRESLAAVLEAASEADYARGYQILDAADTRIGEIQELYPRTSLISPLRAEYLTTFRSLYEACQRFRDVMEQRGSQNLPTCRPPPTGVGNDALSPQAESGHDAPIGSSAHLQAGVGPGTPTLHP
jgi:uncharacterized protein YjdB